MSQARSSVLAETEPQLRALSGRGKLAAIVYRSRAVTPLSAAELQNLVSRAQNRNRREAVTGLVLYDNHRFFQWLEGPAENVGRVMQSIRGDRRHTEIEVLNDRSADARTFGGWAMKLAAPDLAAELAQTDVLEPPREIVETLRQRPQAAPSLLVKLVPLAEATPGPDGGEGLRRRMQPILKAVLLSTVIPTLAADRSALELPRAGTRLHPRARDLAELLVAGETSDAADLIDELRAGAPLPPLYATLLEPAARHLGDLWREDDCSEFDVTLGLCRLQTAVRLLNASVLPAESGLGEHPVVLVAPEPGELHQLGASLDSDVLYQAGWTPASEFPADDRALQELVSRRWFDVLDLSLSAAFRHDSLLPRLRASIAAARRASRNPRLMVVVGGRVFLEEQNAAAQVGADFASLTATGVDRSILARLRRTHGHEDSAADLRAVA